jgi:GNAT superfamily N-acetyltransferase
MSDFEVRFATKKEAAEVANLHLIASRAAYAGQVPDAHWDATPMAKRVSYWKEAIEYGEPQVLVALEGDSIVGFVGYDRSRDKGTPNTMGEIWAIYAAPGYWGLGVGLSLWDAAREGLVDEGCINVSAWVPIGCDRAVRFHELAGFKREMSSAKTVPVGSVKIEEIRLKRALS